MRVFVVLLSLAVCSGCFVADELDSGMEVMKQHRPKTAKAEPEPEPEPVPSSAGSNDRGLLSSLLGMAQEQFEPEPPPPDPGNVPVRCWIGDREHFSTRSDCAARGGRPIHLDL